MADALVHMLETREWSWGWILILMADKYSGPSLESILCKIIDTGSPDAPIEGAVDILIDIARPESVPSLIRAACYRFAGDPFLSIPAKAIHALRGVGNQEAMDFLHQLSNGNDEEVAEKARRALLRTFPEESNS